MASGHWIIRTRYLFGGEFSGSLDLDVDVMISVSGRVNAFHSLATKDDVFVRLSPGWNVEAIIVVNTVHANDATQYSCKG